MRNRVSELRKKRNMTQRALANMVGVAQNTLSYWEQGKYDIDSESLGRIAEIFGVSIDYLLCREDADLLSPIPGIFPLKTKKIPLLGEIACGEPIFADEQAGEYVLTDSGIDADFCLRAKGDSMSGVRILDGDIVFIQKCDAVDNGQIAAVLIEDEATLKRVYYDRDAGVLFLFAENSKYKTMRFSGEELNNIRILGKAVAFQSNIR